MGQVIRMRDWRQYWTRHPRRFGPEEFLRQVGKTVNGVPISEAQLGFLIEGIRDSLQLSPGDALLDLCCGNGLLTQRLAAHCTRAVGVDYSVPLIEVAQRNHRSAGVKYLRRSVRELDALPLPEGTRFRKILMYEALQHFHRSEMDPLLDGMLRWAAPGCRILIGSVPDRRRVWRFYDTPRRRLGYVIRRCAGRHAIGTWWDPEDVARAAERCGLTARLIEQHPALHTAHYRFDMLLTSAVRDGAGAVA